MPPRTLSRGFTLIEVLVAFTIFALIGVISAQLLSQTLDSQANLSQRGQRLSDIHRAMQIIQRDVMQVVDRTVRDGYGDHLPALLIGTDGVLELTRGGWRNPLNLPRAEVQRVGYLLQDNKLLRAYWPVLDRAQDTEPAYQTLLEQVERLEFYALDGNGNEHTFWPVTDFLAAESDPQSALVGVIMRIELPPFGVVERVWEVPSV